MRRFVKRFLILLVSFPQTAFSIATAQDSLVQVAIVGSVTGQPADFKVFAHIDGNPAVTCTVRISDRQICSLLIPTGHHDILFELKGSGVKTIYRNAFGIRPERNPTIDLDQIVFERSTLPVVSQVLGERNTSGNFQIHFTLHNQNKQSLLVKDIRVHAFTPSRSYCYGEGFKYLYRIAGNLRAYAKLSGTQEVHTELHNLAEQTTMSVNGRYIAAACQAHDRDLIFNMPVSIPLKSDEYQEVIVEMPEHFDLTMENRDSNSQPAREGVLPPEKRTQSFDFEAYEFTFTTDDGKTFDAAYSKKTG